MCSYCLHCRLFHSFPWKSYKKIAFLVWRTIFLMIGMRMCVLFKIYLCIFYCNHLDIASSHNVGTLCLEAPFASGCLWLHWFALWGSLMMMVLLMECCDVVCMVAKELKEEESMESSFLLSLFFEFLYFVRIGDILIWVKYKYT